MASNQDEEQHNAHCHPGCHEDIEVHIPERSGKSEYFKGMDDRIIKNLSTHTNFFVYLQTMSQKLVMNADELHRILRPMVFVQKTKTAAIKPKLPRKEARSKKVWT